MADGMPLAEIAIDVLLVRTLLRRQAPHLASLPIRLMGEGWDNLLFRTGDQWLVRIPRRAAAVPLLVNEQRVLSHLAERLPVTTPAAVILGQPCAEFPWPWSVTPYIEGKTLDVSPLNRRGVTEWVDFLLALHRPVDYSTEPAPPVNAHRGVALSRRVEGLEARIRQLREFGMEIDKALLVLWDTALATAPARRTVWLHGDPHPRNAIGTAGRLQAVIDWGDVTAGDPASDLASLWMVGHNAENRRDALARYFTLQQGGFSGREIDELCLRAMGWALVYGCTHLAAGLVDHPAHAAIGRSTLHNLRQDLDVRLIAGRSDPRLATPGRVNG